MAGGCAVAAPRPVSRLGYHARPDRIQHRVAHELLQVVIALGERRTEWTFEQMPLEAVPPVETLRPNAVQALHPSGERLLGRMDNEVMVVAHQAISEEVPLEPLDDFG